MREYSYQATESTMDALRRLMHPWVSMMATDHALAVTTAEGIVVLLSTEQAEVAGQLEVSRVRADVVTAEDVQLPEARTVSIGDLGLGRNDVVLFAGESWVVEGPSPSGDGSGTHQQMQFSGRAGQRPDSATVVCTTTDSIVVAASTGEGILIQLGVRPSTLDVVQDRVTIARFLVQRGYGSGEDPR